MKLTQEQILLLSPQLVQLELADKKTLVSEQMVILGLSRHNLETLRASEHYQTLLLKLKRKSEGHVERHLSNSTLEIRRTLSDLSAESIEVIRDVMRDDSNDPKVRVSAACELLDRDGRFAKVSRLMNVNQGQDGAPELPEDVAADIFRIFSGKETVQ